MRRLVSIAAFTLGLAALASVPAWAQGAAEKRVALVIGNAAYKEAPLKNPVNDARAMAARLRELGFEVVAREDATRADMASAVGEFVRKLAPGGAALIYYAGHGVQVRGRNYLIPVDVSLETETDLRFQAVDIGTLTDELDQAQSRVSFIVLDACRNNPFERRLRGAARGLAAVDAARGSLIAYATSPGSVAADGEGDNGVYTAALLKALAQPGLKAEDVFKRVRVEVSDATKNQQTPWESSSLVGDFVFNITVNVTTPAPTVTVQPAPPVTADREALFWQSVKDSKSAGDFEDYLKRYPQGEYASLAKRRIDELKKPPQQAAAPPPKPAPAAVPPKPAVVAPPVPAPGTVLRDCPECPEMVVIPAGSFTMGSPPGEEGRDSDEGPQHRVNVRAFAAGKYEVTFMEWDACVSAGGCRHQPSDQGWGRANRPVFNVTWNDAREYVRWLSRRTGKQYRLLSEAEWEYAARAGTTTPFHTGGTITTDQANFDGNFTYGGGSKEGSRQKTVAVGSFSPNRFGLHDMHGNVWEWVEDCWNGSYAGAPGDGSAWTGGDCSRRGLRGGSWSDEPRGVRSAFRYSKGVSTYRNSVSGFRVARTN